MADDKLMPRWTKPLEVPECPAGWRTAPPDFVGVGAQRAGTSWWYRTIEQHPRVVTRESQPKELHYFGRFWSGELPDDLVERYHRFFPRPPGSISGEWTPRYMWDFWSLRLLARAAPAARILVLLRDPVERYRSGIGRLIRRNAKRGRPLDLMMLADALGRGLYHQQLQRVFEFFPREQVLVLQYERCVADTPGQLAVTLDFLGLEPFDQLPPLAGGRRSPPNEKPSLTDDMRKDLVRRLEDDVRRLVRLCPEIDPALWRNFRHLAESVEQSEGKGGKLPRQEPAVADVSADTRAGARP